MALHPPGNAAKNPDDPRSGRLPNQLHFDLADALKGSRGLGDVNGHLPRHRTVRGGKSHIDSDRPVLIYGKLINESEIIEVLWGLLPFLMLTLAGVWWGLEQSYRSANVTEVLDIGPETVHLVRTNPRGDVQDWDCNRYWVKVSMHPTGGPVAHYITLKGKGREVEIGAFLSEGERKVLYGELTDALRPPRPVAV